MIDAPLDYAKKRTSIAVKFRNVQPKLRGLRRTGRNGKFDDPPPPFLQGLLTCASPSKPLVCADLLGPPVSLQVKNRASIRKALADRDGTSLGFGTATAMPTSTNHAGRMTAATTLAEGQRTTATANSTRGCGDGVGARTPVLGMRFNGGHASKRPTPIIRPFTGWGEMPTGLRNGRACVSERVVLSLVSPRAR